MWMVFKLTVFLYINIIFIGALNASFLKVVEIAHVKKSSIAQSIKLMGIINSAKCSKLKARVQGFIVQVKNSGESVKKGETIAKIISEELEDSLALLNETCTMAKDQYERMSQIKSFCKKEIEEAKTIWINAKLKRKEIETKLKDCKLIAEFDGTLGTYKTSNFEHVLMGEEIINLYDEKDFVIELDIPVSILEKIKNGTTAEIFNKTVHIPTIPALVCQETYMAKVKIPIKECGFIGQVVDVLIHTSRSEDVIVIPSDAIFLKNAKSCVYKIEDNKAVLTFIETGIQNKDYIEVKSGLNVGDKVVIKSPTRLFEGEEVTAIDGDIL